MADCDTDLRDARATNSALAAENLRIKPKRERDEVEMRAPNSCSVVTAKRPGHLVRVSSQGGRQGAFTGTPSPSTETTFRLVEDIDENLTGIEYEVVRRYCRTCGKQIRPDIPGVIPRERFGINLVSLETIMRMYGIPYGIIQSLINVIYCTNPGQIDSHSPCRHSRKIAVSPLRAHSRGHLLQAHIRRRDDVEDLRRPALVVDDGRR